MKIVRVGEFYTLDEFTVSQTAGRKGLDNTPPKEVIKNIEYNCQYILDPLRREVNRPVVVTSGYRSPEVNKAVGGSKTSQHVSGQATDLIVPGLTVGQVFNIIRDMKLPFDQLIDEFGEWIHVSYTKKIPGRGERLLARKSGKKTVWTKV